MEIFKTLIGNDEIKGTLGTAIASSSFSHAYIIEGASGTGKRTVARLAAAGILCQGEGDIPCGVCPSCKKVLSDIHTDVRFFEVTKVDQIREIKQSLYDAPNESDYKIYILSDAQKMNVKAQNALLISLEDPPKNVVFFLLTTDAGALLETIRSRAQILRTEPLDKDTIFDHLKNKLRVNLPDSKLEQVVMASAGSLGYAIALTDVKKSELILSERQRALDITVAVLKNDAESVPLLLSQSSMSREDLKNLLTLCVTVIGDILLVKKDKGAPLHFFTTCDDALVIAQRYNTARLLGCYDALLCAISDLNMNSNTALTLMSILTNSKKKGS